MVPEIGGFGVVKIRTGKKLEAKILGFLIDLFKTKLGLGTKGFLKERPFVGIERKIGDKGLFLESF